MEKLYLIKASLQNDIERLLKIRMQKMLEIYEAAKITILADCNEKLNCIVRGRQGFIMISFLRSSYITKCYNFRIAFYEKELFVEENPAAFLYNMSSYLRGVEEDISYLWKKADKGFIQVFSWRKEELRRFYMEKIYKESEIIFQKIISEIDSMGEEMGYVEQIGVIGSRKES